MGPIASHYRRGKDQTEIAAMTTYQISKTNVFDRSAKVGKFIVSVSPLTVDGEFAVEPLKARGYLFSAASHADQVTAYCATIAGGRISKRWFAMFATAAEAEAEVTAICETGI